MENNIKEYLHYYINGKEPIIINHQDYDDRQFMLAGVDQFNECVIITDMDGGYDQHVTFDEIHKIKPILRRIESLTDSENNILKGLMGEQNIIKCDNFGIEVKQFHTPQSFHYLLSIGIDLFNLIANNHAIEK